MIVSMVDHAVHRLFKTTGSAHVLLCTCGERITGKDQINCYRKWELHLLANAYETE